MGAEIVAQRPELSTAERIVQSIHDAKSAKQGVGDMNVLKSMLDAADEYGHYACQFCLLEAQMWVQIASLDDGTDMLSKAQTNLVEWIRTKSSEEIDDVLDECSGGTRILRIKNRDTYIPRRDKETAEFNRISSKIESEILKDGRTRLSSGRFYEEWSISGRPKPCDIAAYKSRTKDRIITKYGGVGLGDGSGTYVVPSVCERSETAKAIKSRLESIVRDLKSIQSICKETRFAVPQSGIAVIRSLLSQLEAS